MANDPTAVALLGKANTWKAQWLPVWYRVHLTRAANKEAAWPADTYDIEVLPSRVVYVTRNKVVVRILNADEWSTIDLCVQGNGTVPGLIQVEDVDWAQTGP